MDFSFTPTEEQYRIFDKANEGKNNLVLEAVAGSGKTTTLVEIAKSARGRVIIVAFNRHIAQELSGKLPKINYGFGSESAEPGAEARTIHSIGKQVIESHFGEVKIDGWKYTNIIRDYMKRLNMPWEERQIAQSTLSDLVSLFRLNLVNPLKTDQLLELVKHHGMSYPKMVDHVAPVFQIGMREWERNKTIDFDDMIFLPLFLNNPYTNKLGLDYPKYDKVLVDECQDLNKAQLKNAINLVKEDGQLIFVGDRRQAIMGFAGADAQSFQNIVERTEAEILDLSICFRCPSSHIKLAQEIVPQIKPRENAPEGVIRYLELGDHQEWVDFYHTLTPDDLLICRTNAPIIRCCVQMIKEGIKARVRGMNMGKKLTSILRRIKKMQGFSYGLLDHYLRQWRIEQVSYLSDIGAAESVKKHMVDLEETLRAVMQEYPDATNINQLSDEIETLFKDTDNAIWLSSVHRAKGLQAERVFILYPDLLPLQFGKQQDWEFEQEMNLKYVALTRSKNELIFVREKEHIGI